MLCESAVSRRANNPSDTNVPRTEDHTHETQLWALSIVQGPFSVAPWQTLIVRFATKHSSAGGGSAPLLALVCRTRFHISSSRSRSWPFLLASGAEYIPREK